MQTVKTTLLILIYATLLGACGLKGPLYLSDEGPPPVEQEADPAADNAEGEEEDDEETEVDKEKINSPN